MLSMHTDPFINEYKNEKYPNAVAVVGFPSVGLVGSIAANFISRTMKLERVATMVSKDFPPYTIIHDGIPSSPVRIYAGERTCSNGIRCEQLVVIMSEFIPRPDLMKPVADLILQWCKEKEIEIILTLEGINVGDATGELPIYGVASTPRTRQMLDKYGIKEMKEGMVSGLSGVLLYEGERLNIDVVCLLGPARLDYPDARGAARLLEIVAKMLPELRLDPDPLYKEAEQIEQQMKAALEGMKQSRRIGDESLLYG
ncbi:MAG: PAC2 family protein [Methanomassiliicoccales archaeon]